MGSLTGIRKSVESETRSHSWTKRSNKTKRKTTVPVGIVWSPTRSSNYGNHLIVPITFRFKLIRVNYLHYTDNYGRSASTAQREHVEMKSAASET